MQEKTPRGTFFFVERYAVYCAAHVYRCALWRKLSALLFIVLRTFIAVRCGGSLSLRCGVFSYLLAPKFAYINIFLYLCTAFLNDLQKPSNLQTFKRRKATFSHKLVRD